MKRLFLSIVIAAAVVSPAAAQDEAEVPEGEDAGAETEPAGGEEGEDEEDWSEDLQTGDVLVETRAEEIFRAGGSVHAMDEEELAELSYNDPMAVLTRVRHHSIRSSWVDA